MTRGSSIIGEVQEPSVFERCHCDFLIGHSQQKGHQLG